MNRVATATRVVVEYDGLVLATSFFKGTGVLSFTGLPFPVFRSGNRDQF